jgi:hypothetical protein
LTAGLIAAVIVGCERPRIKSYESIQSATLTNPARDFKKAPLDPYSYGGIARASGGRDPRTSYGSLARGDTDGVPELYSATPPDLASKRKLDTLPIYLVPDPRTQNKVAQYVASAYIDNAGKKIEDPRIKTQNPTRVGAASPPATTTSAGH